MENQVVVYESPERLQTLRTIAGERIALMTKWHPSDGLAGWVQTLKPDAVEIDADDIKAEDVQAFHRLGIKVQAKVLGAWDKPEYWDRAIEAGVDWLQTDLAEEILARDFQRRVPKRPALVSLHRGASRYAPENTLLAFAKAARMGADYVEFDVRTSRDGQFYLLHDGRLDRTTNGSGPLAEKLSEQLMHLDAGVWFGRPYAGLHLPTLDSFLAAVPAGLQLYLDAKAITPEALSEAVERHGLATRTIVYQSAEYLTRLKAINPRIRRCHHWPGPSKSTDWRRHFSPTPWTPDGTSCRKKSLTAVTLVASRSFPMRWAPTRRSNATSRRWSGASI